MLKKFSILIIILIFTSLQIFPESEKRIITFVNNTENLKNKKIKFELDYLINITEENIINKFNNIQIKSTLGEFDNKDLKKATNYIFSHGINAFYYITTTNTSNSDNIIVIKFISSIGNVLDQYEFDTSSLNQDDQFLLDDIIEKWLNLLYSSLDKIFFTKETIINRGKFKKSIKEFKRDIPIISFCFSGISSKLYFDSRINNRTQKIFSVSPLDISLTIYPIKYLEAGFFCRFDFRNMTYNYIDLEEQRYSYYDPNLILAYGVFAGFSHFKDDLHYSIGIRFYNIYYDISNIPEWNKSNSINSYFLPQFAIYQRIDFKLFKILNFSMLVVFKTTPMFLLKGDTFYSKPFNYDTFVLEFSFIGLSLIL